MTNQELIEFLQKFPSEAKVELGGWEQNSNGFRYCEQSLTPEKIRVEGGEGVEVTIIFDTDA